MHVAVDTNATFLTHAGMARYVIGLVGALRKLETPDFSVSELAWRVNNFEYRQPWRALRTLYREWMWASTIAPGQLLHGKADILHRCTSLPIRRPAGVSEVVTFYDLAVIRHPERYRRWHRFSEPHRLKRLLQADAVICISRFAADEAMAFLGLPSRKIEVIYPGTHFVRNSDMTGELPAGLELPDRFFLFVGSLEPGKNLALLKEVFAMAQAKSIELPPLVVVGTRWAGVGHEGRPPETWRYVGYQSDETLAWLYRKAIALVFPSKYEGFGLPVLEAMVMGCPIICSKVASLPEVAGSAALYANMKPQAYLDAMTLLANDNSSRDDLRNAGYKQARLFDWNKCAGETTAVYRKVLKQ